MSFSRSESGGDVAAAEQIRDAAVDDAASIEAVHFSSREAAYSSHVSAWPPTGAGRAERVARWSRWLASSAIHCLVAERDDRIIGFVTVRAATDSDVSAQSVAEMPTLYIDPDHWRSGLGTTLCDAAVQRARDLGFTDLVLWVLDINARARTFYARRGFRPDGATKIDESTAEGFKAERFHLRLGGEEQ